MWRYSNLLNSSLKILHNQSNSGSYIARENRKMSYCKWIFSKNILKKIDSVCSVNKTLRRPHTTCSSSLKTVSLSCEKSKFLRDYLQVTKHSSCGLHTDKLKKGKQKLLKGDDVTLCKTLTLEDCITDKESVKFPEHFEDKDHEKISEIFPRPKETLNNLKNMLGATFMDVQYSQKLHTVKLPNKKGRNLPAGWKATIRITWPQSNLFHQECVTKSQSFHKASLKVLHWLYVNKHIDENGSPIHSKDIVNQMRKSVNRPIELSISFEEEMAINTLYKMFASTIEPFIKQNESTPSDKIPVVMPIDLAPAELEEFVDSNIKSHSQNVHNLKLASEMEYHDPIYQTPPEEKDDKKMKERNIFLKSKLVMMDIDKLVLPITSYKKQILDTIENNRVCVIRGAPGCGKSTRTPSYILNDWIEQDKGAECNVIVSQPRRVAALSLASQVAFERGDMYVGETVGHQVRLATKLPRAPGGGILFCTAGALLRRLASSPQLPGCSHLILDEAHERSADCDTVMTLAKAALRANPKLKVIVMSATIDTQLFSKYYDNCPVLDIPGFTHPVQSHFLKDIMRMSRMQLVKTVENTKLDTENVRVDIRELIQVIQWIHKYKPDGAMLVFLPGWEQIRKVKEELDSIRNDGSWVVLPVHSRLSNEDQKKIFNRQLDGVRKIVLATNIAETSITIDDVVYVIDTGVHKEHALVTGKGISSLDSSWISQSSVAQRKGRAGRVKPGECFHMYSEEKMSTFIPNNLPEIMRIPLEKTVLDCKTYKEDAKALEFLSQFPQPPNSSAIEIAVKDLIDMGALDGEERLTALGRRIASFTTHPKVSKALIHSTIFHVVSPIIDLSAVVSNNIDIYSCAVEYRAASRDLKKTFHPTSDHLAIYWLCRNFEKLLQRKSFSEIINYCKRNYLRRERINSVFDLRKIYVDHLKHARMLPFQIDEDALDMGVLDEFSSVDELTKGVLLSGLNTLLHIRHIVKAKGKLATEKGLVSNQGQRAFLGQTSVNHNILKSGIENCLLLYCGAVHSQERRGLLVRDVSLIHPLTAFLFSQKVVLASDTGDKCSFKLNNNIQLECDTEQGQCLMKLRDMMWTVVQHYIENQGFKNENDFEDRRPSSRNPVHSFKKDLLVFVSELLNKSEISSYDDLPNSKN